jgi:transcriptional regulator with XRE-family HTH domain
VTDPRNVQTDAARCLPAAGELPKLLLRQLAELTSLSNPYLSQLARGTHQPAVRVLKLISGAQCS